MSAHYVYRVYDRDDRLIYVGCTHDLTGRLRYHEYGYSAWWNDQAARAVAKVYRNKLQARAAESEAIRAERPRWNISGKWCTNADWTKDDFTDFITALLNSAEFGEGTLRRARRVADVFFKRSGVELDIDWDTAEARLRRRQLQWSARLGA